MRRQRHDRFGDRRPRAKVVALDEVLEVAVKPSHDRGVGVALASLQLQDLTQLGLWLVQVPLFSPSTTVMAITPGPP